MVKKRRGGKIFGKAISAVAGFTPAGRLAKAALGAAKGVKGFIGGQRGVSRRSRGITQRYLNRAATRLVKARIEGKILREKLKVVNIIR